MAKENMPLTHSPARCVACTEFWLFITYFIPMAINPKIDCHKTFAQPIHNPPFLFTSCFVQKTPKPLISLGTDSYRQKRMKNAMKYVRGSQYHGDAILWLNSSHSRKSSKWRQANMSEIWTVN
ncbi:MAG: hypothetical protein ACE1ZO_05645, partial [Nitrospirales bacterium]